MAALSSLGLGADDTVVGATMRSQTRAEVQRSCRINIGGPLALRMRVSCAPAVGAPSRRPATPSF
jgi:hypothetical protein